MTALKGVTSLAADHNVEVAGIEAAGIRWVVLVRLAGLR